MVSPLERWRMTKNGDKVTPELFLKLVDERRETVRELLRKLGVTYEQTHAELVLTILTRHVIET